MNKRYNLFNYGITWLGILRLAVSVYCVYSFVCVLLFNKQSIFVRILLK